MNSENNSQSENNNQNQNQNQNNNPTFDEIERLAAKQSRFIKPVEGQNLVLQFYPKKTEIKEVDFQKNGKYTKRVNFIVTDTTGKLEGEKEVSFGIENARRITTLLKRGYNKIEVIRYGKGLETTYNFIPVQH